MVDIQVSDITNGDIVNKEWVGTGVFDVLMDAVNKNINIQYQNNRITGNDYANVYLGSLQAVLAQSVQYARYRKDYYIEEGTPRKKQENPSTLTGTTLTNVPENSILRVDGRQYPVSGTVELDFTPGTYRIKIDSPVQYKPKELTVEINP